MSRLLKVRIYKGLTWRGRQNQGFWVALIGILATAYHTKAQRSDNFQESRPNELNARTHRGTLDDETQENEVRTKKADQLECYMEKTRATNTWRDAVRVRNMGAAKLGPSGLRSLIRFQLLARAAVNLKAQLREDSLPCSFLWLLREFSTYFDSLSSLLFNWGPQFFAACWLETCSSLTHGPFQRAVHNMATKFPQSKWERKQERAPKTEATVFL